VIVIPGPPEELAVIRHIFRAHVRDKHPFPKLAKRLANAGVKTTKTNPGSTHDPEYSFERTCIGQMMYKLNDDAAARPQGKKSGAVVDKVFGPSNRSCRSHNFERLKSVFLGINIGTKKR